MSEEEYSLKNLPDQEERDRLMEHRGNVFMRAGAGTGKTYTLVERILELIDPADENAEPLNIEKIAAITFTRRAAGELQTRLRSRILERREKVSSLRRRERLDRALERLDWAFTGTIHSFADRLLREIPMESEISPNYTVVEETENLTREVHDRLMAAVRRENLADELTGTPELDVSTVEESLLLLLEAGVPEKTREYSSYSKHTGLDSLVKSLVNSRTAPEIETVPEPPDEKKVRSALERGHELVSSIKPKQQYAGDTCLATEGLDLIESARQADDLKELFVRVAALYQISSLAKSGKYGDLKAADFSCRRVKEINASLSVTTEDSFAGHDHDAPYDPTLKEQIYLPLKKWFAPRIKGIRKVCVNLYEQVKQERGLVDQTDLLLRLRNVLRDKPEIRERMKGEFDHILVDEFQDTDPLQCEIVFYLSEKFDQAAGEWEEVQLREGILTLVGDAKQSIYRFRGADIETYDRAYQIMKDQEALIGLLKTNFRSEEELISLYNEAFPSYLGESEEDERGYDSSTGEARYEPVITCPPFKKNDNQGRFELLTYQRDDLNKPEAIKLEAKAVAAYLRWLTNHSGEPEKEVRKPKASLEEPEKKPCQYSDVAILGRATTHFGAYLREFARQGIPVQVSGGSTFLEDDLVKQFILGLRAISDPDDGVARAALERPPFFAVDYGDLVTGQLAEEEITAELEEAARRRRELEDIVAELRKRRLSRSPVETALDLLEETALARYLSSQPHGSLQLTNLYHLVARLNTIARNEGLNYDGATRRLREWIDSEPDINAPASLEEDAVKLMTTYQAKGLEFPVVVLFDGAESGGRSSAGTSGIDREGKRWFLDLHGYSVEHHPIKSYKQRQKDMDGAEKKRLFYVAATRARDRLVVPWPMDGDSTKAKVYNDMFGPVLDEAEVYNFGGPKEIEPPFSLSRPDSPEVVYDPELTARQEQTWQKWHKNYEQVREEMVEWTDPHQKMSNKFNLRAHDFEHGRYGMDFGHFVHRCLELILSTDPPKPTAPSSLDRLRGRLDAVLNQVAREQMEEPRLEEAREDIKRTLESISSRGWLKEEVELHTEYPVNYRRDGEIVSGVIDLLVVEEEEITIVDFKTDSTTGRDSEQELREDFEHYFYQLQLYEQGIQKALPDAEVKTALLFTETGKLLYTKK